jgi:hypothetical protein
LQTFVEELFHEDHGSAERIAVILQEVAPTSNIEMFLHDPRYQGCVKYLHGSGCMS